MKKLWKNSVHASALQITMAIALIAMSAILLATSFRAAPSAGEREEQHFMPQQQQEESDAPAVIGTCDTAGPIEVESTGGVTAPTAYATLGAAFSAINAGTHTGSINIEVCGNTTETTMADLSSSGTGSSSYTDVTVRPVGAARIIEGSLGGASVIRLNGADNVTIDGRIGGVGTNRDLTVRNNGTITVHRRNLGGQCRCRQWRNEQCHPQSGNLYRGERDDRRDQHLRYHHVRQHDDCRFDQRRR